LQLEPKDKMRSRGLPSPDRADAVLAAKMNGLSSTGAFSGVDQFFHAPVVFTPTQDRVIESADRIDFSSSW